MIRVVYNTVQGCGLFFFHLVSQGGRQHCGLLLLLAVMCTCCARALLKRTLINSYKRVHGCSKQGLAPRGQRPSLQLHGAPSGMASPIMSAFLAGGGPNFKGCANPLHSASIGKVRGQ
jgi:hypothetical protein